MMNESQVKSIVDDEASKSVAEGYEVAIENADVVYDVSLTMDGVGKRLLVSKELRSDQVEDVRKAFRQIKRSIRKSLLILGGEPLDEDERAYKLEIERDPEYKARLIGYIKNDARMQ